MLERVPPQNIEAEQAVLGAMLLDRNAVVVSMEKLKGDDFYRESHRIIFEAMEKLHRDNKEVDIITVTDELTRMGRLEDVGGLSYITALPNMVATAANVEFHADIVSEKSMLRSLITVSTQIATMGYEADRDAGEIVSDAERMVMGISQASRKGDFASVGSVVETALDQITAQYERDSSLTGLSTGFRYIDELTSGLQNSDLIIIAARPSMGKTAFTLNLAQNIGVRQKKTVAFFSLEMSKEQLTQRLLCQLSHLDSQKLRTGQLNGDEDWDRLTRACSALYESPIYIDDTPGITLSEMRSKARRLKAERGLSLVIVDYLQLMQGRGKENRQQEISEISRGLKGLARELNVPIIALSQLSRGVESRTDKRPMLSDLRESGSLEQDADIVAFLYREGYYDPESERKDITEVIVAKHRNGPTGKVELFFKADFTLFLDIERNRVEA